MCGGGSALNPTSESASDPEKDPTAEAVAGDPASGEGIARVAENPYATDFYAEAEKAPAITSVTIPASVESIDPAFFQLFPSASRISVDADNSSYTDYNGMVFSKDLTSLTLVPEGFEGTAVLPANLATVPACVFSRCIKLTAIAAEQLPAGSAATSAHATRDGILYSINKNAEGAPDGTLALIAAPAGLGASASIAPECTSIAEGAFWGNEGLKTILASGAVSEIFSNPSYAKAAAGSDAAAAVPAFNQATTESATVLTSERQAWEAVGFTRFAKPAEPGEVLAPAPGDSGLTYTLLESGQLSVKWTGDAPASGKRTIPSAATLHGVDYTVAAIEDDAFANQTELTEINLPDTITSIGAGAFAGCTSLGSVSIPGSVASIGEAAFAGCHAIGTIELHDGTTAIAARAFEGTGIQTLALPASIQSIGDAALADCAGLTRILLPTTSASISPTALGDTSGVAIYAPVSATPAWPVLPASGNTLCEYAISGPAAAITLTVDAEADLYAQEGASLQAPGEIEATYSYKGAAVYVDANGIVKAKTPGSATITATLKLDGTELAKATADVIVHAAPKPIEPEEIEEPEADTTEADNPNDGTTETTSEEATESDSEATESAPTPAVDAAESDGPAQPTIINQDLSLVKPGEELTEEEMQALKESSESGPQETGTELANEEDVTIYEAGNTLTFDLTNGPSVVDKSIDTSGVQENDEESEEERKAEPIEDINPSLICSIVQMLSFLDHDVFDADTTQAANARQIPTGLNNPNVKVQVHATSTIKWYYQTNSSGNYSDLHTGDRDTWSQLKWFQFRGSSSQQNMADQKSNTSLNNSFDHILALASNSALEPTPRRWFITVSQASYAHSAWFCWPDSSTSTGWSKAAMDPTSGTWNSFGVDPKGALCHIYLNGAGDYHLNLVDPKSDGSQEKRLIKPYQVYNLDEHATPSPVNGWQFDGWYNSDGTRIREIRGITGSSLSHADITLTARWTPIKYTYTINPNGGKFSDGTTGNKSSPFDITTNDLVVLGTSEFPTRDNYQFVGWCITGDMVTSGKGCGILYSDSSAGSVTVTSSSTIPHWLNTRLSGSGYWGNVTYTAMWASLVTLCWNSPPSYTTDNIFDSVYYYPGYGYRDSGDFLYGIDVYNKRSTFAVGTSSAAIASIPEIKGYTYNGCYTARSGGTQRLNNASKLASNVSVAGGTVWYAQWSAKTYTVTLTTNGGTTSTNKTSFNYTPTDNLAIPTVNKTGCTFMGWKIVGATGSYWADNSYNYTTTGSYAGRLWPSGDSWLKGTGKYGDLTLIAVWRNPITLDGNAPSGATVKQTYTTIYYYDTFGYLSKSLGSAANFASETYATKAGSSLLTAFPTINNAAYTFGGYFSATTSETQYLSGKGSASTSVNLTSNTPSSFSGSTTWYARWFVPVYAYGNGGSLQWQYTTGGGSGTISSSGSRGWSNVYKITVTSSSITGYALWSDGTTGSILSVQSNEGTNRSILGWKNSDGTKTFSGTYIPGLDDRYMYAQWSKVTVKFDLNGGSGTKPNDVEATYNVAMPALSTTAKPTRTGYWFAGWFDGSDKHNKYYNTPSAWSSTQYYTDAGASARKWDKTSATTLYAGWVPIKYTIKYDANVPTGTTAATGSTSDTTALYDESATLAENGFSRTGYTFRGWGETSTATTYWSSGATVSKPNLTTTHNGEVTLYAIWQTHAYTINYDGNTNTGGETKPTGPVKWDSHTTLATNGFTKTGYHFIGWAKSADGAVAFKDGETTSGKTFPNLTSTDGGSYTLYAKWEPNIYKVYFDKNVDDTNDTVIDMPYWDAASGKNVFEIKFSEPALANPGNQTVLLSDAEPKRVGYDFLGWQLTDTDTAGNKVDNFYETTKSACSYRHPFDHDVTMKAIWQERVGYHVSFYKFTGDNEADKVTLPGGYLSGELKYEETFPLPEADMVPDSDKVSGYYLYGWSYKKEAGADGTAIDSTYVLKHTTSIRELFASLGIQPGDSEHQDVKLYAVWQMVYSVTAPLDSTAAIVLDASEKQVMRASEVVLTSTTPAEIAVGAKSEYNADTFEHVFPDTRVRDVEFSFLEKGSGDTKYFPLEGNSPYAWVTWQGEDIIANELTRIPAGAGAGEPAARREATLSLDFNPASVNISHALQYEDGTMQFDDEGNEQQGQGWLMNGTRWKDPIARITWLFKPIEESALTYTLLPSMPAAGSQPGAGEAHVEADTYPFEG